MASHDSNELPEVFELIRLRDLCRKFIDDNKITRYGDILITASINICNTAGFIESICKMIGYCDQER
jgi:hypothetical protein